MATSKTFNGTTYSIPAVGERLWGTNVRNFLISVADNALAKSGGNFTLTAELNFGATYGVVSAYLKSRSSNISTTGILRLANNEGIGWRNAANNADQILKLDAGNRLELDGVDIPTISSTDTLTNKSISGATNTLSAIPASSLASTTGSGAVVLASGATLTSPAITTPTGIVKGDVGLGNVDNTSDATKNAASVTLSNKTLLTPVIDDYQDINEESAPSTPSSGKVRLYAKTDKKLYTKDSAGTELQVGASGSGEINAITTGSTDSTGWSTGTGISAPATDTSNSPLSPVTTTSLAITGTAGVVIGSQTSAYGAIKSITMPTGLLNRKLKVEFYFTTPASSAGTWAVSVYQGSTRLALSTDSSGDTILPSSVTGGKFTAYFDTSSSTSYTVNIVQRTYSSSNTLYVTSVIVGPGIQPQGAVVGEWQSYTPTLSTNPWGTGAALNFAKYRRVGGSLEIKGRAITGTGTGANLLVIPLPSGLNITHPNTDAFLVGKGMDTVNTTGVVIIAETGASTTNLYFGLDTSTNAFTKRNANDFGDAQTISWEAVVEIAEWAGSGTVNLAQNDVEWAYNTSTANSTDTSSFGYGPGGVAFGSYTSSGGTGVIKKRVRFQTPIQPGDSLVIEYNYTNFSTGWQQVEQSADISARVSTNANTYGVYFELVSGSTTDIDISFGNGGRRANNTANFTSGSASSGAPWSDLTASAKWRVRKSSAGAAVGFGIVVPGTSSGLVSASGLPGNTTGSAIASGYVGEKVVYTASAAGTVTAGTYTTLTTTDHNLSIPSKGVWIVLASGGVYINTTSGSDVSGSVELYNSTTSTQLGECQDCCGINITGQFQNSSFAIHAVLVTTGAETVRIRAKVPGGTSTFGVRVGTRITAVRIA